MMQLTLKWLLVFVLMSGSATAAEATLFERAEKGDASAQFDLGVMYIKGDGVPKDSTEAVKWYRKAAEQGDAVAQLELGVAYANGFGVPKDSIEAVRWYRMAAEQGHAAAQHNLSINYAIGVGVAKDSVEAVAWSRKAAEQGYAAAYWILGNMYATGEGVPKDRAESIEWYRKGAEKGYAAAQFEVGAAYATGDGVAKDSVEAGKWYHKAAEQGYASAQFNMGLMCAGGEGVVKDSVEAMKWYRKAAEQGHSGAQGNLGSMYANGTGAPKDAIEGLAWTNIAAASGAAIFVENRDMLERRVGPEATLAAQQRSKQILKKIEAAKRAASSSAPNDSATSISPMDETPKASGSGTIVSAGGHVLTAAHVVAGASRVKIFTAQGMRAASVLRIDEANDLAVLKLSAGTYPALLVVPSRKIRLGQSVATIGFPNVEIQGFSPKVTRGEISSLNGIGDDPRSWQISAPVQPGNSGGALLDENGNVIGVVLSKLGLKAAQAIGDIPQNVNYAVKSTYALALLEPYLDSNAPEPNQSAAKPRFEDMVAKAQQSVVLILVY